MALRWAVIIVGVMFVHRPLGVLKRARGVFAGVPCCLKYATRRHKASFGHNSESPVAPWPIFSPHAIFLCAECKYQKGGGGEFIVRGGGKFIFRGGGDMKYTLSQGLLRA